MPLIDGERFYLHILAPNPSQKTGIHNAGLKELTIETTYLTVHVREILLVVELAIWWGPTGFLNKGIMNRSLPTPM